MSLCHQQSYVYSVIRNRRFAARNDAGLGIDRPRFNALPIDGLYPRVRLSSGGPGRDPNPEFPPRNPISDRLRLPVSRSGYRKKGWRVAQPKDPPAPSLG